MYDIIFLAVFTAFIVWFLYSRRKKLEREGPLYLYRTKFGIKTIDWFSKKFKNQLNWLQYVSITTGYLLMGIMLFLFFQLVYIYARYPQTVRAIKIPPVMPLIPYLPSLFKVDFLPPFYFTYWIVILAVVAIVHEFSHGIFAKLHGVKIKSTGFGFLGPFLAAFVDPDEKSMNKKPIPKQLSILSAGTFANIIISVLFIAIFIVFFALMYAPAGAMFNTYSFSEINISQIDKINSISVNHPTPQIILKNLNLNSTNNLTKISSGKKSYFIDNNIFTQNINSVGETALAYDDLPAINSGISGAITEFNGEKVKSQEDLKKIIAKYKPGDKAEIKTKLNGKINYYNITLANNGNGKAYIGIGVMQASTSGIKGKIYYIISLVKKPGIYYESRINEDLAKFINDLIWWMILINISVALVNMLPLGIFDGGRVFYLSVLYFVKSEEKAKKAFKFMTWLMLFFIGLIMIFWALSVF